MAATDRNTSCASLMNTNLGTLRSMDISDFAAMGNADSESESVSTTLSQKTKNAISKALSPSTWRSYVTAFEAYAVWCNCHGISPIPTTPAAISNFLSEQADSGRRHATLRISVCAIAYIHRLLEIASPTDSQLVRSTLRGIGREDSHSVRQADPLTLEILSAIRKVACEPRKGRYGRMESPKFALHRGRVDIALSSILFHAGLRRSETVELRWKDIERQKDGSGLIVINRSKMRQPVDVQVVAIPNCTMADLDAIRPRHFSGQESVFGFRSHQLDNRLKSAVRQAGTKGNFSAHSGRVGMAIYLKERSAPDHIIRQQGRWKDNRMVDRYTKKSKSLASSELFRPGLPRFIGS